MNCVFFLSSFKSFTLSRRPWLRPSVDTRSSLWKQIMWGNAAFCSFIWSRSPYCVDLWAYPCFKCRVVYLTRKWLMENLFLFFLVAPRHKIHQSEHDTSSFPGRKVWRELQIHSEVSGWTGTRGGSQQRYDDSPVTTVNVKLHMCA